MKKYVKHLLVSLAVGAATLAAHAADYRPHIIRFGYGLAEDSNQGRAAKFLADDLARRTGGKLHMKGFASAALTGEDNADAMRMGPDGQPMFLSNHAGGILGGVSTGQPVVARVAFKPTSSILIPRQTLNEAGEEIDLRTKGRHDPCVGIRGVPVVEAMTACVLADAFLRHRAQTGGGAFVPGQDGRR